MSFRSAPYGGESDLRRILSFTSNAAAIAGDCGRLHVGDVLHRFFNGLRGFHLRELVELWEDQAGDLVGWAAVYPREEVFDLQVHPEHRGGALEEEMVRWAERDTFKRVQKLGGGRSVKAEVFRGDIERARVLEHCGFRARGHRYDYTARSLDVAIPTCTLREGFLIRSAEGEDDADMLADVHTAAFGSIWKPGEYRSLMRSPGYEPERELVVVAPDGRFAALCIYWLDPINRSGLLEPVGTGLRFRRMGLSRALVCEALRRMKRQGAETAIVWHPCQRSLKTPHLRSFNLPHLFV